MKILILKPSSLGDVVQALPVLRLIKRHLPESEIYWWIDSAWRRCWRATRTWPGWSGSSAGAGPRRATGARSGAASGGCGSRRFDWVIDLQCLTRSGVFAWLANGKLSVGLDEAARRRARILRP